ncbi:alpha/beta hydrolase [Paenibacillus hamazuiensis]|uniref:alpha/beta hydrolase n=1 Tax=Paenibacillus hamazuiensis TaxID=2936508 RepID=UPI00200EEA2D|nr:alpha/beta hydrolase [Paenibacillus hamazuiensis]
MRPTPAITRAPRRRSAPTRILWILLAALLVLALASVGISVYVGWQLTHPAREALTDSPDKHGLAFDNVQFMSRTKDVNLNGWFLPGAEPRTNMTLVLAHGYRNNRLQTEAQAMDLAGALVERGYNVLMFDFRNSGESEGKLTSVGYFEKNDLLGAIDWVKANQQGVKIGLVGFSMGATTSLMAAAEEPAVAGIVADSPFAHLTKYLRENLPVWSHLPNFPFTPLILGLIPPVTGIDPDGVDALAASGKVYPRPVLFIHSVNDHSIPFANSEAIYKLHPDKFELWQTTNEGHAKSHAADPKAYEQKVLDFFAKLQ